VHFCVDHNESDTSSRYAGFVFFLSEWRIGNVWAYGWAGTVWLDWDTAFSLHYDTRLRPTLLGHGRLSEFCCPLWHGVSYVSLRRQV
jgi:hypothetical protein